MLNPGVLIPCPARRRSSRGHLPRTFTAIVNPAAGGSASASTLIPLARTLREAGAELAVEYSRGLEHAAALARAAAAAGRVVLGVGGDGMVGGVGGALAGTGAVLGIVAVRPGQRLRAAARRPVRPGGAGRAAAGG